MRDIYGYPRVICPQIHFICLLCFTLYCRKMQKAYFQVLFSSAGGPGKRLKHGKKRIPGPLDLFLLKAASLGAAASDISEMTE